jgi:pyruvate formate-lyase activating enzyme-like uncharacterized protein
MDTLNDVNVGGFQNVQAPKEVVEMIMYVERLFYNKHIDDIRARQDKLKNLWQDDTRFLAFWLNNDRYRYMDLKDIISPGCHACLYGNISHVRHSYKCSQDCKFCYYRVPSPKHNVSIIGKNLYSFSGGDMQFTLDEILMLINRQAHNFDAIGWLEKEPLEEIDNIEPVMRRLASIGMHQYMYTNGIHANRKNLDRLAEWGLDEIRFNLQASDFNPHIIKRIGYAKERFEWVLIETPMYSESYANFIKHKDAILETRLTQINLPELQICAPELLDSFVETEGPIYKHRRGYVSPISSRHYVYDLIELAEEEDWPVIINDCSNDTKYFRGAFPKASLGHLGYESSFELPFSYVMYLADQILEDGVEYEFF